MADTTAPTLRCRTKPSQRTPSSRKPVKGKNFKTMMAGVKDGQGGDY